MAHDSVPVIVMPKMFHAMQFTQEPEKVYAALTTQKGLAGWWAKEAEAEPKEGGKVRLGFDGGQAVLQFEMKRLEPARRVVWECTAGPDEWVDTKLEWILAAKDGGTFLEFHHNDWKAASGYYGQCNAMWGFLHVRSLPQYLETGKGEPIP